MRIHLPLLGWILTTLLMAASAQATPFSATLTLGFATLPPAVYTGSGTGTSVHGPTPSPNLITIPSGIFAGTVSNSVTADANITNLAFKMSGHGPGAFTGTLNQLAQSIFTGTPLHGPMSLFGALLLRGNFGAMTVISVPLFTTHNQGSTTGAFGVGIGGAWKQTFGGDPNAYVRADFSGPTNPPFWTVYLYHLPGGLHASMTLYTRTAVLGMGSDARTSGGAGLVSLVAPLTVNINLPGTSRFLVGDATLSLHFVPEPGTLLLLASGVGGLVVFGCSKRTRH